MEYIEHNALHLPSHDIDPRQIRLEIYRLGNLFLAEHAAADIIVADLEADKVRGPEYHFLNELRGYCLYSEITRILIYTAIQCRIFSDKEDYKMLPPWGETCGELEEAVSNDVVLGKGALGGSTKALTLREAFNKIIHAEVITTDYEDVNGVQPKLNSLIYLYGKQWDTPWRATLDILDYVRLAHDGARYA